MKNKDLIAQLQKLDPESDVCIYTDIGEDGDIVSSVKLCTFDNAPYMKGASFEEINKNLSQPFVVIYAGE